MAIQRANMIVVNGVGNTEEFVFKKGSMPLDISQITRAVMAFGDVVVDSLIHPSVFDWTRTVTAEEASANPRLREGDTKLCITLGLLPGLIPEGTYAAPLVVYDADNPQGLLFCIFNTRVLSFALPAT